MSKIKHRILDAPQIDKQLDKMYSDVSIKIKDIHYSHESCLVVYEDNFVYYEMRRFLKEKEQKEKENEKTTVK